MDVKCVKCGEPWDSYGLSHGDVCAWEADMIRQGRGCLACKGKKKTELTTLEHFDNEAALEGGFLVESDKPYGPEVDYIQLCKCEECGDGYSIDVNYIYYDGSRKIIYNAVEHTHLDNKVELERYVCNECDWVRMSGKLLCKNCFDKYTECDGCGLMTHESESFYISERQETYCEDCFGNLFTSCTDCGNNYLLEELTKYEDNYYCEWCSKEYFTTCEVCGERFEKINIIYGKNDEVCCSEKCADATTEI